MEIWMIEIQQEVIPTRSIWDYWAIPDFTPRDTQKVALDWMANLPANKKYIFCQLPVGSGKSLIAVTYAGFIGQGNFGSSYILTPQRVLQKQYEDSFDNYNLTSVYGKANYMCHTKVGMNCDMGDDIKKPKCENCNAKEAFKRIAHTPNVVLNYKLALLYSELFPGDPMEFPKKDLMVFDECHTLENQLVNHRAVNVSKFRCDGMKLKFFKPSGLKDAHAWLIKTYFPAITSLCVTLEKAVSVIDEKYEFSSGSLLPSELKTKKEFKEVTRHKELVKRLTKMSYEDVEKYYVLVTDDKSFQFKEIYGAGLFKQILLPKANRFLFMSSTVLNFEAFAKDLGIPPEETAIIDLDSEFDIQNRPVYFMPTSKMSYGWNKPENKPLRDKMANKVITLCNIHKEDSGIIHTGSFQLTKWLIEELKGKINQEILTHGVIEDGDNRDDTINRFMENEGKIPMVLISPSITEGLDLTNATARFAMFVKIPYPSLADEWVKRRLDLSDEWYQRQAMIAVIQGGGRIVRSHEDWGNTYILDDSFNYLWFKFKNFVPKWWKNAFIKTK
jgi:Rad3-related DNA helicase